MEEITRPILTISIATYNRSERLLDLIRDVIQCKSEKIEILVVDNHSTDDTVEKCEAIDDARIRIVANKTNIGGQSNIMRAIFQAKGKYCLYINDRDILYPDKLDGLLKILSDNEVSFLHIWRSSDDDTLSYYEKGFESYANQKIWSHPTGMIYNMDVLKKYSLTEESFETYNETLYGYSFVARFLMFTGKTAVYKSRIWAEDSNYYESNRSKFDEINKDKEDKLFFSYNSRVFQYGRIINQLCELQRQFNISNEDMIEMILLLNKNILGAFVTRRIYYMYKALYMHYGLKRRYIPVKEILREFEKFNTTSKEMIAFLPYSKTIITRWEEIYEQEKRKNILAMYKQIPKYILIKMGIRKYANT